MSTSSLQLQLPPPDLVRERIAAIEDELKALRRLLRASVAAEQAEQARLRRLALESSDGGEGAAHAS